jgi:hypothetical protein
MTNEELNAMVKGLARDMAQLTLVDPATADADEVGDLIIELAQKLYTVGYGAGLATSSGLLRNTVQSAARLREREDQGEDEPQAQEMLETASGPLYEPMIPAITGAIQYLCSSYMSVCGLGGDVEAFPEEDMQATMGGGDA